MRLRVLAMACALLWAQAPWAHVPAMTGSEAAAPVLHAPCHDAGPAMSHAAVPDPPAPPATDATDAPRDCCCGGTCASPACHCACPAGVILTSAVFIRLPMHPVMAPSGTPFVDLPPDRPPDFFRPPI